MRHFNLDDSKAYQCWRQEKLLNYPENATENLVHITNPDNLSKTELQTIKQKLANANWVIYDLPEQVLDKSMLQHFGQQFSLQQFDNHTYAIDGISEISTASPDKTKAGFIPYTSRRLKWHTDGYYRPDSRWVSSIILHCNQPAKAGGLNQIVDPEMLYIFLRDNEPRYIEALMRADCFEIPAFEQAGSARREVSQGPVFWFNADGQLQMRYTQRTKNIQWSDIEILRESMSVIAEWLETAGCIHEIQLKAGQGILSRNVLHNRTAFEDDPEQPRCLLRARYLDTIQIN